MIPQYLSQQLIRKNPGFRARVCALTLQPVFWETLAHSFRHLDLCFHICCVMSDSGGCFIKAVITHIMHLINLKSLWGCKRAHHWTCFLLLLGYLKQQPEVMPIYYLTTLQLEVGHRSHRAKIKMGAGLVPPEAPGKNRLLPFPSSRAATSLAHGSSSIFTNGSRLSLWPSCCSNVSVLSLWP